ncbi:hypothetical protein OCD85_02695 [Bacillus pacificus]|uniref:Uncharacterized protein n=1 Tax=Bacillus phage J5a TaxID=2767195 RepID=A0A7S6NKL4_9CAUD|nr:MULTISPECIES: hypothetical protein [Bacillus cereus group]YP_010739958.1 hypothetical protein P9C77_gp62 [Bacillus phage J5a]MCC2432609.1 hypothetical protein [Bacillus paranthracis]MCU5359953.1 hypothetical protein [Bacillus pacificus]MCU5398016.1 hypothetical protein [Bacillus pacificus]QOQ37239.2 hypothetical protein J5a_062 [Bacillus phage J5a]
MKYKMQLECRDKECRTVMFGHFLEGMNCVKCGGPTIEKPYSPVEKQVNQNKNSELTIQVSVDTTEALEGIKEVTEAANECADALEKLEKVMNKFKGQSEASAVSFDIKSIAQSTIEQTADSIKLQANKLDIKRSNQF